MRLVTITPLGRYNARPLISYRPRRETLKKARSTNPAYFGIRETELSILLTLKKLGVLNFFELKKSTYSRIAILDGRPVRIDLGA